MISNDKKQEVLSRINEIENFVMAAGDRGITIGVFCTRITAECAALTISADSLAPILRTALVIN